MFELPKLGYAFDALEPHIDAKTMELHHDKHHAAYIEKLNAALQGHEDLQKMDIVELITSLDKVPEDIRTTVRNNGGGHANHSFFLDDSVTARRRPAQRRIGGRRRRRVWEL